MNETIDKLIKAKIYFDPILREIFKCDSEEECLELYKIANAKLLRKNEINENFLAKQMITE